MLTSFCPHILRCENKSFKDGPISPRGNDLFGKNTQFDMSNGCCIKLLGSKRHFERFFIHIQRWQYLIHSSWQRVRHCLLQEWIHTYPQVPWSQIQYRGGAPQNQNTATKTPLLGQWADGRALLTCYIPVLLEIFSWQKKLIGDR